MRPARLAAIAPFLCGVLLLASAGSSQAQPSPSPSASPTDDGKPSVRLLNPSPAYDPQLDPTRDPDPPKISDKLDVDETYHVVAWSRHADGADIAEASITYPDQNEITVGTLDRAPDAPGVWELAWDVPNTLAKGDATFRVALYDATPDGLTEIASDETAVDVEQRDAEDPTDTNAAETVELTWPSQGGGLGFYKGRGGSWATIVDGTASLSTARVALSYSVSDPGDKPEFTACGQTNTFGNAGAGVRPVTFSASCTLGFGVIPSDVTALAAVAESSDASHSVFSQGAADVHAVHPYLQSPGKMTLDVSAPFVRGLKSSCLVLTATARDEFRRPVQGANVDVHLAGIDDQVQFGTQTASGRKAPDAGGHGVEAGSSCSVDMTTGRPGVSGQEGLHRRPSAPDTKHLESTAGTGLSGPMNIQPGQWRFALWSVSAGIADVTAWIDDEELAQGAKDRPLDDDALEAGEPTATAKAQWFASTPTVTFDPRGGTAAPGQCQSFIAKARSGTAAVPFANLDLHAQSKLEDVRFCTPAEGGSQLRAPDKGTHDPIDSMQSRDQTTGTPPPSPTVHTETETDGEGNVLFGLTSQSVGDATVTAWIDGETGSDNDVLDGAEPRGTATASWADCASGAHVSFVNPSAYGSSTAGPGTGTNVSTKLDADNAFHVVVRSDCPSFSQAIEIQQATGTTFKTLGEATRIGETDTYEFLWKPVPADGSYQLRAHAEGAPADEDQTVLVNAQSGTGGDPTEEADEALELTAPQNGRPAAFVRGATRVEGIASAGAEGIDIYYSTVAAKDTPVGTDWTACGYVDLNGSGTTPQQFFASCTLKGADQPSQVTAVAALTADCGFGQAGCDASPTGTARSLPTFKKDSGDAHRVFGFDSLPQLSIGPAENEATVGHCTQFALSVSDETGQPMTGENVDIHLTGPGDEAHFCSLPNNTPSHPPDQGGHAAVTGHPDESSHETSAGADTFHIEGQTDAEGRFVFAIDSPDVGDSTLTAWLDRNDDDVLGPEEVTDDASMHWIAASACSLSGTPGDDVLTGTRRADRICGLGGNDTIRGLRGNDVLLGGAGRDRLTGGAGRDVLSGGSGPDRLNGGPAKDRCRGGSGRDVLRRCERPASHRRRS